MTTRSRFVAFVALFLTLSLAFSLPLAAQTGTSAVLGTITDPQGRLVSGAEVTLTNQATGNVRSMKTSDSGGYNFDLIIPGTYRLEVVAKGFKKQTLNDVRALIGKPSEATVQLEIGTASEVIEVQASNAGFLVNSQDASLGNNVVFEQISQLPLNAKDLAGLLTLQPGATKEGYVTGARADQSNVTLDGVDINSSQSANTSAPGSTNNLVIGSLASSKDITNGPVLRLNTEATEEFRVTTANGNANQGRSAGSQINLVTKSGTNAFHGAAFETYRPKGLEANNWFNNHAGIGRENLIRHVFSGGLGGPIIKDKLFFFYNYEGERERRSTSVVRIVPLAQSPDPLNAGNLGTGVIHYEWCNGPDPLNPCTSTAINSLDATQNAAAYSNQVEPVSGLLNPAAQAVFANAILKYKSNDTTQGDQLNTGGFRFNAPTPTNLSGHVAKFDLNLTKNQTVFLRLTVQKDTQAQEVWLPGTKAPQTWSHPWGLAAGHTWTIGQNWVNNFRYGLTRQAFTEGGDSTGNDITFRFVFQQNNQTHTLSRVTPVHNITDDVSWIHGSHSIQFGTNIRTISNSRVSFANAFDNGVTNPSWYAGGGERESSEFQAYLDAHALPGAGGLLSSTSQVQNAATALIGRLNQYTADFTFAKAGTIFAPGTPSTRNFATQATDFYLQDSWKAAPNLTLTFGLRYALERPVYEKNGYEVRPVVPLTTYFANRLTAAANGQSDTEPIVVNLSGPANHGKPLYDWDYKNFQPRFAFAWSPAGTSGKSVLRGGFALTTDYYGQALAVDFDLNNTLGFTSSSNINANTYNTQGGSTAPLFTAFGQNIQSLPGLTIPANLTFPLSQPLDYGARIETSVDSHLTAPKEYVWNLTYERQMKAGLVLSASYIGRKAQHLLARRDVASFNNIRDPQSGLTWYQAGTILEKQRQQGVDTSAIASIPFFDNLYPAGLVNIVNDCNYLCAGFDPTWTNTQTVYAFQSRGNGGSVPSNPFAFFGGNDWTDTTALLDQTFNFFNQNFGANYKTLFMGPQYGALSAWSTIGNSTYNAFTFSARQRLKGLTLDFNYTWSHSLDDASGLQTGGGFGAAFIQNPIRQRDNYATSDFDTKHSINANGVWELPFGKGRAFMNSDHPLADAVLGGWQLSSVFRWNTGIPQTAPYDDARWATNWNAQSNVTPTSKVHTCADHPANGTAKLFGAGCNLTAIYQSFRNAYPGETGPRNIFRLPSYISLDFGIAKSFKMPWKEGHMLQLRLDAFNVANHQSFNAIDGSRTGFGVVRDPALRGSIPPTNWSNFTLVDGRPREMQIQARYSF